MDGTQITPRQQRILDILLKKGGLSRTRIAEELAEAQSKMTLMRDLKHLAEAKLILAEGKSRSTTYVLANTHPLLSFLDLSQYFSKGPDSRAVLFPVYREDVLRQLTRLFTKQELQEFDAGATEFFKKMQRHPDTLQRKELQRFVIEFSWKSSRIEGNTYSLFETENLIANRSEAVGHPREEAIMILNHKNAFDHILTYRPRFRSPTQDDIFGVHAILTHDLSIAPGIRKRPVRITGTRYLPSSDEREIESGMRQLIRISAAAKHPAERAFILLAGIAYIQAFEDGNKRTSRVTSNAVLLAHDLPPLSYRSIDEDEYRQAMVAFYERNTLYHLKRLFMEQFRFAREQYFLL